MMLTHVFFYTCTGFDGCSEPTYASESAAAIITMVFQHTDNGCKSQAFRSKFLHIHLTIENLNGDSTHENRTAGPVEILVSFLN